MLQALCAGTGRLRLDLLQMFGGKGKGRVHIVVPALVEARRKAKQGGTVELQRFTPEHNQGWSVFYLPAPIQGGTIMSEENNPYTFENETYRKTYWHTCSSYHRAGEKSSSIL